MDYSADVHDRADQPESAPATTHSALSDDLYLHIVHQTLKFIKSGHLAKQLRVKNPRTSRIYGMNAFFVFRCALRAALRELDPRIAAAHPSMRLSELMISGLVAQVWESARMGPAVRAMCKAAAEKDLQRRRQALRDRA